MIIYGAGLAGLVAAHMLRRHRPTIREAQASLPHNHRALLRFRTDAVSRATGIPFRRVLVYKDIFRTTDNLSRLAQANAYSLKVTGALGERSILNLDPGERWIAPGDFIAQLADGLPIEYNLALTDLDVHTSDPVISTIPMNLMAEMAGWEITKHWPVRAITAVTATVLEPQVDVFQTLYCPGMMPLWYRASLTGAMLTLEFPGALLGGEDGDGWAHGEVRTALIHFGFPRNVLFTQPSIHIQSYGKLLPIDEAKRQAFILWLTEQHSIYSVGRFATWRQLLLDDVVRDIKLVEHMIAARSGYQRALVNFGGATP